MKRNALIAGAVGLVVVILAWYFIIYSPIGDDLSAAETSTASEQAKTQDLENTLARLAAQSKNSTRQEALLRKFDQAIPEKSNLAEFIIQLNKLATSSGIKFQSISPSPPAAGGSSSVIALSINIGGSFFQVKNYLSQLERLERLVIVDGVSISAAGDSSAAGSSVSDTTGLTVSLTGRMFTRSAPQPAAGTPGATTPTTVAGGSTPTTTPGGTTSSSTPSGGT
ncbi:MAG: type 4a pilus biogenesis protein PilO [Acidimicrobiia bacterium]